MQLILAILFLYPGKLFSQCSVSSSTGYTVHMDVTMRELVKPNTCASGYNYNLRIGYTIWFTGENIPASMYTLQARAYCGAQNLFFDLPNNAAMGELITAANPWRGISDCATSTLSSLNCRNVQIEIHGPGVPAQYVNCTAFLLPIRLLSFTAEADGEGVLLRWSTATEQDNEHYTIERSTDGDRFEPALIVPGAGDSETVQDYQARDPWSGSGTVYYRLRQTDRDGTSTISDVVSVLPINRRTIVYPNPVTDGTVQLIGDFPPGQAIIVDAMGRVVSVQALSHKLDVHSLPSGSYSLRLRTSDGASISTTALVKL